MNRETRPSASDVPSPRSSPRSHDWKYVPRPAITTRREADDDACRNRERAEDAEPGVRQRQCGERQNRSDADDHRRSDQVCDALERDRRSGLSRVDAVAEQDDLQRLTGNAAEREIAEGFGGEAHAREPREADACADGGSSRPTPTSAPGATGR